MPATVEGGDTAQGIVPHENNQTTVVNEGHTDATRMVVDKQQDGGAIDSKSPLETNEDVLDKQSDYDDKFENEEQDSEEPVPAHIRETE